MRPAKGIQRHPIFKLGKAAAARDSRNLRLKTILKAPVKLPREYDFDAEHAGVPTPMFGNDRFGDCVIAGRAHQTLRFEFVEQKKLLAISDGDVVHEYFEETGGADSGLVVLDSLRRWRKTGWIAAASRYFIQAFAEVNRQIATEIKRAVFTELGVGLGLLLPLTAQKEFSAGKPWTTTSGPGSHANSWGGHYVYVTGYTTLGPTCVSWGRKQQMSWKFVARYCDEAYAIVDALDTAKKRRAIDGRTLRAFLATVSAPTRYRTVRRRRRVGRS